MNKNLIATIASITMIVIGAVITYFCKFPLATMTGFAVTMFGAGLAVATLWNGRDKEAKSWLVILGISLIGLGAFLAGIFGVMSEEQVKQIIGFVFAGIALIAGIIVSIVANRTAKKVE